MFRSTPLAISSPTFVAPSPDGASDPVPLAHSEPEKSMDLPYWARRLVNGTELGCARELAGLSDVALEHLSTDFKRFPRRPRTDPWRLLPWIGSALVVAGGAFLIGDYLMATTTGLGVPSTHLMAIVAIGIGVFVGCIGAIASYSLVSVEMAYAKVGLYVSAINAQHPWLYEIANLARDNAPEAYRLEVLKERGPLRGVDFVMMQEIARAQLALNMTQPAHQVVARVQSKLLPKCFDRE